MKYRYREPHEMKDSGVEWLGMIPKKWEVKSLKYLIEKIIDNRGKTPEFGEIGIPMLEVKQITQGNKYPSTRFEKFTKKIIVETFIRDVVKEGDILLSTVGATSGKAVIVDKNPNYFIAQNIIGLRAKNNIQNDYLYYMTSSNFFKESLYAINKSNTIDNLKVSIFINNLCILPEFKIQQKIADFLDKKCEEFDSVIAKKEMLINKLEEAKKSLISEVVTGKVKVIEKENGEYGIIKREAHEMKDSGSEWLGMIPKEWKVKKIKYCFDFFRGLPITKLDLKTEGVACLNYGEIHSKYPFLINSNNNELQKVSEKYLETNMNSLLKYGDFVFADTSEDLKGSGNFTFIEGDGQVFAGYHTITMRCKMSYLKKYLAYLFESTNIRKQIQSKVKGVKVYSITQNILKDIDILISVDEIEIAKFLDEKCSQFDLAIGKQKESIEKLKSAKQSLISEVVTGKIEVL